MDPLGTPLILKRARVCENKLLNSAQPTVTVQDVLVRTDARVLLRRVYFRNEKRSRYVSVGFYPSDNYQVLSSGVHGSRLSHSPSITSGRWWKPCRRYATLCNAVNSTHAETAPFVYGPAKPITVLDCIATKSVSVLRLQICAI